jgi:hypothetical protein
MLRCPTGCDASPSENAALRNPIRVLRKDWSKNPIADQKKERLDRYARSFSRFRTLIARRDPSVRRKTFPNTDDTRFLSCGRNTTENRRKMDALVMTDHVFWPNESRKRALLLPIWLPNSTFLRSKHNGLCRTGAGGVGQAQPRNCARSITPYRILFLIGLPALFALKKSASRQRRNPKPSS